MLTKTPHRLKGTLRSDYEGADLSLVGLNALECDWRVIFRWLMRQCEDISLVDSYGAMSDLWHNHPLTVLVEIDQSNGSVEQIERQAEEWIARLQRYCTISPISSPAIEAAWSILTELKESLSPSDTTNKHFNISGAIGDIKARFETLLAQIESSGDMDSSLSLLLIFVRNYCTIAQKFNRRLEAIPDLFRDEILQESPKGVTPDKSYVVVTPAPTEGLFRLHKQSEFTTGERIYRVCGSEYVTPAKIIHTDTIFNYNNIAYHAPTCDGSLLFDGANVEKAPIEYGVIIASPMLLLSCGERIIMLKFILDRDDEIPVVTLYTSSEEGWQEREYTIQNDTIKITISANDAPLSLYAECGYPAIKIIAKESVATELNFQDIEIKTEVSGMTSFGLFSEVGEMDPLQPFHPFGVLGERGAWFVFGSDEIRSKSVESVILNGVWSRLPDGGFEAIYRDYDLQSAVKNSSFIASCAVRDGRRWSEMAESQIQLFKTKSDNRIDEEAEFRIEPQNQPHDGYFRVQLQHPLDGFSFQRYRELFAERLTYNSTHSERKHRPIPKQPVIPMIGDLTLGYSATERLSERGRIFRLGERMQQEELTLDGTKSYPILPKIDSSLIISLKNCFELNRLRLFFEIKFFVKGALPQGKIITSSYETEYYSTLTNSWQPLGRDQTLAERTGGFFRSGYIELKLDDVDKPSKCDTLWVRYVWREATPNHIRLNNILLNCFAVTATGGDGSTVEAGHINKLCKEDDRIIAIEQPFDSYGGRGVESREQMRRRITTQIATRGRAVTSLDYEALILERFPEVDKVCCLPANREIREVRVVVFAKPQPKSLIDLPSWRLARIESYIKGFSSPFSRIKVLPPNYEAINIRYVAEVKAGIEGVGVVRERLKRRAFYLFASWFVKGEHPVLGQEVWHKSLLSRLSNDESIGETIELTVDGADPETRDGDICYKPHWANSVLLPKEIDIELQEFNDGVGGSGIGVNFIIE